MDPGFLLLGGLAVAGVTVVTCWRLRQRSSMQRREAAHTHHGNLRTLLDAADETVMLLACDGRILEINETACIRLAQPRSALLGQSIYGLIPADIATARRNGIGEACSQRTSLTGEDWIDGRCLAWRMHPVQDDPGPIERIWLFAKDITRHRQQQALDGIFQQFDRHLLRHQASLGELGHKLCHELLPLFPLQAVWIARQTAAGELQLLAATGTEAAHAAQAMLASGGNPDRHPVFAALAHAEPRLLQIGDPGWSEIPEAAHLPRSTLLAVLPIYIREGVFGILALHACPPDREALLALFDSTSFIAAHASLAFEAAYEQSRLRLYEQALASTGTAVFITDTKGNIVWVNEAFVRVSGFARSDLYGRSPTLFASGEHDPAFYKDMWETLGAGRIWRSDITNRRQDGSCYVAHQTISPVQGEGETITHFVSLLEDITERHRATEALEHLASHDPLTSLPNRRMLEQTLPRMLALAQRTQTRCALLFIDLDRFKPINDRLGHAAGDEVLCTIARRLQATLRTSDSIARFGGDEFVATLPDAEHDEGILIVVRKLLEACAEPIEVAGESISTGASIGIAIFPDDATDSELLITLADEAMYRAKLEGCNGFHRHHPR